MLKGAKEMKLVDEIAEMLPLGSDPDPYEVAQAAIDVVERRLFDEVNMMILAVHIARECNKEDVTNRSLADCIIKAAWEAVKGETNAQ
jgi:hypothetical protein